MIDQILKRDGTYEKFEEFKIRDAIKKAFKSVHITYDSVIYLNVIEELNKKELLQLKIFKTL